MFDSIVCFLLNDCFTGKLSPTCVVSVASRYSREIAPSFTFSFFFSLLKQPAVRKSEEDAGAFQRTQATELQEQHDTEHNEQVTELVSELNEIENNYLEQGYTKGAYLRAGI